MECNLCLRNFLRVLRCHEGLRVEGGGDKRLGVEDGKSRVSHTESGPISDILDPLEETIGVNIGVGAGHPGVGVACLLLDGVQVVVSILEVTKLILSMEL